MDRVGSVRQYAIETGKTMHKKTGRDPSGFFYFISGNPLWMAVLFLFSAHGSNTREHFPFKVFKHGAAGC